MMEKTRLIFKDDVKNGYIHYINFKRDFSGALAVFEKYILPSYVDIGIDANNDWLILTLSYDSDEKDNLEILEIKEIRINNTLAGASKDILKKLLNDYDKINDYFSNKKYNTFVELLNNAKIVAASEDYLIISFKNEADVTIYDKNLKQIELFLKEIYQKEYKTVAINEEKWSKTKEEYINNKKNNISYVIMDENVVKLKKNDNSKIKKENELESSATDIFGENMVSIK